MQTTGKFVWTYDLAMAASKDAANSRMRKEGRKAWNQDDYNHACETFNRLYPIQGHYSTKKKATK